MSGRNIPPAPNLHEFRGLWRGLGGQIDDVRRTGEERYSDPKLKRTITVNKRRKDAPRKLVTALRRLRG
jgi:hypothetical protein